MALDRIESIVNHRQLLIPIKLKMGVGARSAWVRVWVRNIQVCNVLRALNTMFIRTDANKPLTEFSAPRALTTEPQLTFHI